MLDAGAKTDGSAYQGTRLPAWAVGPGGGPLPAWSKFAVALLAALCFILTLAGSWHRDIGFDEDVDHRATMGLRENPLMGNGLNGSQARLPHYATLLAYRVAEAIGFEGMLEWNMVVARFVSSAAAALTVCFVFLLGHRAAGISTGLLAGATLSVAPYYLGFGGIAYTNGDAFCPIFVTASVWAYVCSVDDPRGWRLAVLAICIGFAVASKFLLVMILPGLVICDLLPRRSREAGLAGLSPTTRLGWMMLLSIGALICSLGTMIATRQMSSDSADSNEAIRIAGWLAAISLTIAGLLYLVRIGVTPCNWMIRWVIVLPLAAAVSLSFFPEHVLHHNVLGELLDSPANFRDLSLASKLRDALLIYGGVTLVKLGLPFGIFTCFAIIWAIFAYRHQLVVRASLMVCVAYGLFLSLQPLKQTFYPMAIYPLMILITILALARLREYLARTGRWMFLGTLILAYGWLSVGLVRVFPHYHLYGYETVGTEWRGHETRGFIGLFFIDQEGNREALEWCVKNLPSQSRVVSALRLPTSVERTLNRLPHSLTFVQLDWPWLRQGTADWETIRNADYLIIHLNNRIYDRATPTPERLAQVFEPEPLHTVYVGRGEYKIPVVEIFRRKPVTP